MTLAAVALAMAMQTPTRGPGLVGVFFTGNQLYEECLRPGSVACPAFVMGVTDAVAELADKRGGKLLACVAERITSTRLVDVVVRFMRDHPELRKESAAGNVIAAIEHSFPCATGG